MCLSISDRSNPLTHNKCTIKQSHTPNTHETKLEHPDGAESRRRERWLAPGASETVAATTPAHTIEPPPTAPRRAHLKTRSPAAQVGGHEVWRDLEGWRRNKRDLEDRLTLASRRAERRDRQQTDDDFTVDDGDEDAWVHDGIDDIQIDPETKKAASELSYDERSIDAEYEPYAHKEPPILNRTRITTIAEVIPMSDDSEGADRDSTKVNWRFLPPQSPSQQHTHSGTESEGWSSNQPTVYLPASYLTIDQAQKLIDHQQQQLHRQQNQLRNQERQLAALSSEPSASIWTGSTPEKRQLLGDSVDLSKSNHLTPPPVGATNHGHQNQKESKP